MQEIVLHILEEIAAGPKIHPSTPISRTPDGIDENQVTLKDTERVCSEGAIRTNGLLEVLQKPISQISDLASLDQCASECGFFFLINFCWSIVALQCCVSFYCTAKWFVVGYPSANYYFLPGSIDASTETEKKL